ncbi:MAG TPA: EF-hand domain-containing protein [Gemmataceae bacterium]|nr:EF-hand domain-containing protein [Gemmataceae bacterium]
MKTFLLCALSAGAFVLLLMAGETPALRSAGVSPAQRDDVQDFVFLAEARPVLVRLHVRMDGKPLSAAWDDFMKYLFAYLDLNGDGMLSKQEAERAPPAAQLGSAFGGLIRAAQSSSPKMEALDGDKDGKVSLAELSAYYRNNDFQPFQFQLDMTPNEPNGLMALYTGGARPDPAVAAVSKAIFALLDSDNDGKLTAKELGAAPAVLLARDENEDEIVTTQEVTPQAKVKTDFVASMMRMGGPRKSSSAGNDYLVPVAVPGKTPAALVRHLQKRYISSVKEKNKKLSREALGLDEATFAPLDADQDGALDDIELAAFVQREPDLCVQLRFGAADKPLDLVPVAGRPALLASRFHKLDAVGLLDLGATRMELRLRDEKKGPGRLMDIAKERLRAQFKSADKDNNGYLDEKEAKPMREFSRDFARMDRDGDGKLFEKEMLAYLDDMVELQQRASGACVTLVLRDQSRGLFDLLDSNRDGRLSVREIKQAPKLLAKLDRQGKGYLEAKDIPRSYQLTMRRGAAERGFNQEAFFAERYFGNGSTEEKTAARGPGWFRKMDRNRDGDVSRKEFLFRDELFRKIDTDGDGLISVEEAEKAGDLSRKN